MKTIPLIAGVCLLAFTATADEALTAAAKKIFAAKQDSIVWITGVAKLTFSTDSASGANIPDQENKVMTLGTVIDPSGLVIAPLSLIDPSRMVNGRVVRGMKIEASSTLNDTKVTLGDGTEIPADLVMKDADLDLAFFRLKMTSKEAKGVTLKAVDLQDSGTGNMLDGTVTLSRMDESLNRVASVGVGEINTITKHPRVFLRAAGAMAGCPTFLADGKLLGITTTRLARNSGSVSGGPISFNPVAVILPAKDILEIAEQAKTAKPAESKPATQSAGTREEKK